jgi:hypothetical protein
MTRVVILTGCEMRHDFVRKAFGLDDGLTVARTYAETTDQSLTPIVEAAGAAGEIQRRHLEDRVRSEDDFFGALVRLAPDRSNPCRVLRGAINDAGAVREIQALAPDVLVAYGCSLVKEPLLSAFAGRFLNVHLGLSPYYRGSGTNFWALVNGEPECVGATIMHIDAGVDTGEVVHQVRARVYRGDTSHQIGNRLIADMVPHYIAAARNLARLPRPSPLPVPANARYYRKNDFTPDSVRQMHEQFAGGMIERYLAEQAERHARVPILVNPIVEAEAVR